MKPAVATLVLAAIAAPSPARADAVAYSCGADVADNIQLINSSGACTGFSILDAKGVVKKKVDWGFPASGMLLSSADGNTVVMIQNGLYGSMAADGMIESYGKKTTRDPIALLVYRGGKKLAAYRLSQLVVRNRLVTLSTSHVQWLAGDTKLESPLGKTFTFTTSSFRTISIDLETGKLDAQDSALWKKCSVIAYGEVNKKGGNYRMDPAFVAKGDPAKALEFSAPASVTFRAGSYATVCFDRRKGKLVATETIDVMLNALTAP